VAAFVPAAASAGGVITETVQHRTDHLSVTAPAGQNGAFSVAVNVDTENDRTVPVGAQEFAIVFRQQGIQPVVPEQMLAASEKQKVHQQPGEEATGKGSCFDKKRME
jgi:hypothetical protein